MRMVPQMSVREAIVRAAAQGGRFLSTVGPLDVPGAGPAWGALWEHDGYGSSTWAMAVEDGPRVLVVVGREEPRNIPAGDWSFRTAVTRMERIPPGRSLRRFARDIGDHLGAAFGAPELGGARP